ncbi:MAG: GNAT family N-acetyltransferase [Haloarculaceae archaeon]
MNVRQAVLADRPAIRDVARRSLTHSYELDDAAIVHAIEEWYSEDRLATKLDDDHRLILVAEVDGQVVSFSESEFGNSGGANVLWVHVDPAYRGQGIGPDLFDETERTLREMGATHLSASVLAHNEVGNEFYRERGFDLVDQYEVEIGDETYTENFYVEGDASRMETVSLDDGTVVYVSHEETDTGSLGPFRVVYADVDGEEKYGYYCTNCETLANAMDAMGRIECNNCGNVRKPTRWDAAYL